MIKTLLRSNRHAPAPGASGPAPGTNGPAARAGGPAPGSNVAGLAPAPGDPLTTLPPHPQLAPSAAPALPPLATQPEPTAEEVASCLAGQELLWLDVEDPTPDDLERLRSKFGFHPLAIEDALRASQRPKIDEYPGYFFIIFYGIDLHDRGRVRLRQISIFLGETYLITVHAALAPEIAESARRWQQNRFEVGRTVGAVLYSVLDTLVDHYFPVMDQLVDQIETLEDDIIARARPNSLSRLLALKRSLLSLRRVFGPERDVLNVLIRPGTPAIDEQTRVYMQDVYDHVLRVTDTIDTYRDLLAGALDAYMSVTANNLNVVMKRMTAISTILMSMTIVASIYGMNFINMPELHATYGYYYALGLMAAIGAGMGLFFKRIGWF